MFFLVPGLMLFDRERFLELVCLIFGLVLLMDLRILLHNCMGFGSNNYVNHDTFIGLVLKYHLKVSDSIKLSWT